MTDTDVSQILRRLDESDRKSDVRMSKVEAGVSELAAKVDALTVWQVAVTDAEHDRAIRIAERMRLLRAAIWLTRQGWARYAIAVASAGAIMRWVG